MRLESQSVRQSTSTGWPCAAAVCNASGSFNGSSMVVQAPPRRVRWTMMRVAISTSPAWAVAM
jgi:hypothetical protein